MVFVNKVWLINYGVSKLLMTSGETYCRIAVLDKTKESARIKLWKLLQENIPVNVERTRKL